MSSTGHLCLGSRTAITLEPLSMDVLRHLTSNGDEISMTPAGFALAAGVPLRLEGDWSKGGYFITDIRYRAPHHSRLQLRWYAKGETELRLQINFGILPDLPARFVFELRFLDGQTLFLPRTPGRLKATCKGRRIDLDEISHAELELMPTDFEQVCHCSPVVLDQSHPDCRLKHAPMVDELGQLASGVWPGKVKDPVDNVRMLRELAKAEAPAFPEHWTRYGGSTAHRFETTGWFRTHHDGQRWWLVDPDGGSFADQSGA